MKKILIIAGGLQFGGMQRFAVNIINYAPVDEFAFDYLIFNGFDRDFAPEVLAHGGRVLTMDPPAAGYRKYVQELGKLIDENHYDVVHSQMQFSSGINLWTAKKHGVPVRIAHSHTTAHEHSVSKKRLIYEKCMRTVITQNATDCLACGVQAGEWMYAKHPFQVISNGIDTASYRYSEENRKKIRKLYGIADDDFVIGHSGTLSELKNQKFLIHMIPEIQKVYPGTKLLLMGKGKEEMLKSLQDEALSTGVQSSVIFAGAVNNVNECLSAIDVYAFPSLREGTPLAVIEAQSNGVPCIISNTIPKDVMITDLVKQLPLNDNDAWIDAICRVRRNRPADYAEKVSEVGYDVRKAYESLYQIYRRKN